MDLALNNLQRLICHKTKTNQPNQSNWLFSLKSKKQNVSADLLNSLKYFK